MSKAKVYYITKNAKGKTLAKELRQSGSSVAYHTKQPSVEGTIPGWIAMDPDSNNKQEAR